MKTHWHVSLMAMVCLVALRPAGSCRGESTADTASRLLRQIPVQRGLCVVLGADAGPLALNIARRSELVLYVQSADDRELLATRRAADEAGWLGSRIFVHKGGSSQIHLADNLADAVVASGAVQAKENEVLRVLRPEGKAVIGTTTLVKPVPAGMEDWTHPYHGSDNNPASNDQTARAPYLTQFLAEPYYCSIPQVSVAAGGRLFKTYGHIAYRPREWGTLNSLIATNAYNGVTLWKMDLSPGFVIHRNTLIATPDTLFLGDDTSCKLIDAATGKMRDEIVIGQGTAEGPVWKWMGLEDGVLYALVGKEQPQETTIKRTADMHGWPWGGLGKGYDPKTDFGWGLGRTILAIDPKTKKLLWTHKTEHPVDSRAVCLRGGRLYFYCHQKSLGCLDARSGKPLWTTSGADLLAAIGEHDKAQSHTNGWATSAYMKCGDKALVFAGPQRTRLVVASAEDGRLLWQYPKGNFQVVLLDDALYAMGTWQGKVDSGKFDLLTGKALPHRLVCRSCCTRATATIDSIFVRGGGTNRYDLAQERWENIGPMRPGCHDGIMTANGLLYAGPWMCDCNNSLVGIVCMGPAGDFEFGRAAQQSERLEGGPAATRPVTPPIDIPDNWPTYRKDNERSSGTLVEVPAEVALRWKFTPKTACLPTAAVAVGDLVFLSGTDGVVRAIHSDSGRSAWTAYTGGPVMFPPTVCDGRVFVGSGDGWVYCFRTDDGSLIWRFRAAPMERVIPAYGQLSSTWPVASGVLVADGVAYAAAGMASYDGTHVYALDAKTGRIQWQNNTSGGNQGVGVQGHLLLHNDLLYLAGGNTLSPAAFDARTGMTVAIDRPRPGSSPATAGRELFLVGDRIKVSQHLLYEPEQDFFWAAKLQSPYAGYTVQASGQNLTVSQDATLQVVCRKRSKESAEETEPVWKKRPFEKHYAMAVSGNAAVVVGRHKTARGALPSYGLAAFGLAGGEPMIEQSLPSCPVQWGLAIDRGGRVFVSLRDGSLVCFQ